MTEADCLMSTALPPLSEDCSTVPCGSIDLERDGEGLGLIRPDEPGLALSGLGGAPKWGDPVAPLPGTEAGTGDPELQISFPLLGVICSLSAEATMR